MSTTSSTTTTTTSSSSTSSTASTTSTTALPSGQPVEFLTIDISADEESYCLSMSADLANVESYEWCSPDKEITIFISNVTFIFVIDDRTKSRGEAGNESWKINGRSKSSRMDFPYAEPYTKSWEATSAKGVVQELCYLYGLDYDFQVTNWPIAAGILSVDNESPMSVIKKIAEACGGVVQTNPGGDIIIRYKYPISPSEYNDQSVVALSISDIDEVYSISEDREYKPGFNLVYIGDKSYQSDISITNWTISTDPENKQIVIGVMTSPYQEITLLHSGDQSRVTIINNGTQTDTIEEQIAITEGSGSVSKPILEIVSYSYQETDLGAVTISGNNSQEIFTNTQGYSLLTIEYTYKYQKFILHNETAEAVQFYIDES